MRGMTVRILFEKTDRQGIPIIDAVIGLYRGDDDHDQCINTTRSDEENTYQDGDQYCGNDKINGHGKLEVKGLLALIIDEGMIVLFYRPDYQRPK
jgi:hypothetical protein